MQNGLVRSAAPQRDPSKTKNYLSGVSSLKINMMVRHAP